MIPAPGTRVGKVRPQIDGLKQAERVACGVEHDANVVLGLVIGQGGPALQRPPHAGLQIVHSIDVLRLDPGGHLYLDPGGGHFYTARAYGTGRWKAMARVLIENLSDHAGDLLGETQQLRIDAANEVQRWQDRSDRAAADMEAARRAKPIWQRLLSVQTEGEQEAFERMEQAQQHITEADFRWRQLEPTVRQQHAGVAGEVALATGLSSLSDDWILLRGYRNGRGETDAVVIGPSGLWAVEVKNYNASLTVDGNRWSYQRLDRRGKVVDEKLAVDGSGRSWARQVIDVAEDLSRWLIRNHQSVTVHTAVILTHERARVAACRDPEVDLVSTDTGDLLRAMARAETPLTARDCSRIAELIRRDHRYHNR